jgi:hypothetical protein
VLAIARDVQRRRRDRGGDVEEVLDPLVALQPPEIDERRLSRAIARAQLAVVETAVDDAHALALDAEIDERVARAVRDRHDRDAGIEEPQRHVLERERRDAPDEPELGDVVLAVDVEDEQHERLAHPAPQAREERDAVDDLEHDIRVAAEAAQRRPRRAREDRQPRAHAVHREALVRARDALGAGVGARDDRHAVAIGDPARHLAVQDRARASGLRVRPVPIREDQDVPGGRHAGATVPSPVMPAAVRIGVLIAIFALLVPSAALAQTGGGGAGDSQYQDPFGSSQPAKPAQQQPARQQQTQSSPEPARPAPAAQSTAPQQGPQQTQPAAQTLPRTGYDVLPVAAAGLLLVLGGLALWRRPHGAR